MTESASPVALVVAAHPDDEVLGCGGVIARWKAQGWDIHVLLLSDGESSRPDADVTHVRNRAEAANKANAILGTDSVELLDLPDNQLDTLALLDITRHVETRVMRYRPSVLLTHHAGDVNIDHRIVHDAVIAACRPQPSHPIKKLLFFEVPSSTEWRPPSSGEPFVPNVYGNITDTLEKKLEALRAYSKELRDFPHPRSVQAVEALAKWRGACVGVMAAEAFILGRQVF